MTNPLAFHKWSPIAAFIRLGWRRSSTDTTTMLGLIVLYCLILLIFWGLWRATSLEELARSGITQTELLWYLIVTECVVMAIGFPYRVVETEIQNGEIASALMRPVSYPLATLAEWSGQTLHRGVVLAFAGCITGVWITGSFPIPISRLPFLLVSMAIGCLSGLICQLQIGYVRTWMDSSAPVFWIWQKLLFVLGGLMVPLTLYPVTLGTIARWSPFAGMLYSPGSLIFDPSAADIVVTLATQLTWLFLLSALARRIERKAAYRFAVHGI